MSIVKSNGRQKSRNLMPRNSFLDEFFNSDWPSFSSFYRGNDQLTDWVPAANITEKEKQYLVELSVPGFENDEIHVEVDENNTLHIRGEHKDESKEESEDYTRQEFSYGSFTRSFRLPETVNDEKISAKCKNGMLRIELPKKDAILMNKKKEIKIS